MNGIKVKKDKKDKKDKTPENPPDPPKNRKRKICQMSWEEYVLHRGMQNAQKEFYRGDLWKLDANDPFCDQFCYWSQNEYEYDEYVDAD